MKDTSQENIKFNKDIEELKSLQRLEDITDDAHGMGDLEQMWIRTRQRMNRLIPIVESKLGYVEVEKAQTILLKCRAYNPTRKTWSYVEENILDLNLLLNEWTYKLGLHFTSVESVDGASMI